MTWFGGTFLVALRMRAGTGTEHSAHSIDGTVITSLSVSRVGQTRHE